MNGPTLPRVVLDVNVLFRATVNPNGASGLLMHAGWNKRLVVVASRPLLEEFRSTLNKPSLRAKYNFSEDRVEDAVVELAGVSEMYRKVPSIFEFPRDPKDAYLVDLAVAARADVITSTDNDLLDLMADNPDGRDFRRRFPDLEVLTPPELLRRLRSGGADE